jgi:acyl carrier protein
MGDVRSIVMAELERSCRHNAERPRAFSDQQRLADDLGLGSIEVVELIASIAGRIDPSRDDSHFSNDVRTVGDLCRAFESVLPGGIRRAVAGSDQGDLMQEAARRAERRLSLRNDRAAPETDSTE